MEPNLQTLAWEMVGPWFWNGYSIFCAIGSLALLAHLLRETHRNALTYARMIWLGGFILGVFVRFNSACQPLSAAFLVTSGTMMSVLVATDWCRREGSFRQKMLAVIRDAIYHSRHPTQGVARKG